MQIRDDGRRLVHREGEQEAFLRYRVDDGRLILVHTEVPEALGGRGIGSALVSAAVDRARADGLAVVAECSFASAWLRRHTDDLADLTVEHASE